MFYQDRMERSDWLCNVYAKQCCIYSTSQMVCNGRYDYVPRAAVVWDKKNANHSPVSSIDPNETCSVFRQIISSTRGVFHAIHSDMLHLVAAGAGKCDLTGKKLQEIMTHKSNWKKSVNFFRIQKITKSEWTTSRSRNQSDSNIRYVFYFM